MNEVLAFELPGEQAIGLHTEELSPGAEWVLIRSADCLHGFIT